MPPQTEAVAHAELVAGGITAYHEHVLFPAIGIDGTGTQSITTVVQTCNLDTVIIGNSNYALSSSEITIVRPGIYLVSYFLCYEIISASGGPRGSIHAWIDSNDSGPFSPAYGSYSTSYHEEIASTFGNGATFLLQHLNSNSKVRIRMQRITGTTDLATIVDRTHLSMIKVG